MGALPWLVLPLRGTLVALLSGALIVVALAAPATGAVGRVFCSGALRFFGKYSYGLYVFQGLVAATFQEHQVEARLTQALGSHGAAMAAQAAAGVGLSLLLATGSYELFEKHFLRLKGRLAPPSPPLTPGNT